jgi:hypothetical protein
VDMIERKKIFELTKSYEVDFFFKLSIDEEFIILTTDD